MRGEKVNLYVCRIDKTDTLKHDYKVNRYRRGEFRGKKNHSPIESCDSFSTQYSSANSSVI